MEAKVKRDKKDPTRIREMEFDMTKENIGMFCAMLAANGLDKETCIEIAEVMAVEMMKNPGKKILWKDNTD